MNRRKVGRAVAATAASAAFALAGWAAYDNAMPELRFYDGYYMMLGATLAVIAVAPFIWRWRRDRSLVVIAVAAAVGSTIPLVISAVRHQMPIVVRFRGSWILAGADIVGPAVVVGFVCLWLAVRAWTPR
jgi:glutathione S-transferase